MVGGPPCFTPIFPFWWESFLVNFSLSGAKAFFGKRSDGGHMDTCHFRNQKQTFQQNGFSLKLNIVSVGMFECLLSSKGF